MALLGLLSPASIFSRAVAVHASACSGQTKGRRVCRDAVVSSVIFGEQFRKVVEVALHALLSALCNCRKTTYLWSWYHPRSRTVAECMWFQAEQCEHIQTSSAGILLVIPI